MTASKKSGMAKIPKVADQKKKTTKPSHPPTSVMVMAAIGSLKEKKGSSLVAIKKYIASNYTLDPVKHGYYIKKSLSSGIKKNTILQVKGRGASGSFKLAKAEGMSRKIRDSEPASKVTKSPNKEKVEKAKVSTPKKTTPKKAEKLKSAKSTARIKKPITKKAKTSKKLTKKVAPKRK